MMLITATLALGLLCPITPQSGPKLEETATPFGDLKAMRSRPKQARATKDRHEQNLWLTPARLVSGNADTVGSVHHAEGVDQIWLNEKNVAEFERVYTLWVGNNDGSYAAIVRDGGSDVVVINGKKVDWLDRVDMLWMDASGKHVAVSGAKDGKNTLAVDGKTFVLPGTLAQGTRPRKNADARNTNEQYVLPFRTYQHFQFSADGTQWLALVDCKGHVQTMANGGLGPEYAAIRTARFSPDGKRLACAGTTKKGKSFAGSLLLDGKPKRIRDGVSSLTFSPDSSRLAFVSATPGRKKPTNRGAKPKLPRPGGRLVVGDYRSAAYDDVGPIAFSADSKRWAVLVRKGKKVSAIIDGEIKSAGTAPKDTSMFFLLAPVFSPDCSRVAYWRYKDKQVSCHVDGLKHGFHDRVLDIRFSPDSKRVVVLTADGDENSVFVDGKLHRKVPLTRGGGTFGTRMAAPSFLSPNLMSRSMRVRWTPDSRHLIEIRGSGPSHQIRIGGSEVAAKLALFATEVTTDEHGWLRFWGGERTGKFVRLAVTYD